MSGIRNSPDREGGRQGGDSQSRGDAERQARDGAGGPHGRIWTAGRHAGPKSQTTIRSMTSGRSNVMGALPALYDRYGLRSAGSVGPRRGPARSGGNRGLRGRGRVGMCVPSASRVRRPGRRTPVGGGRVTEEPPALAETVPAPQAAAGVVLISFAASSWYSGGHGVVGMIRRGDSPLGAISPCAIIGIWARLMPMSAST